MEGRALKESSSSPQVASEVLQSSHRGSPKDVPDEGVQPSKPQSPLQPLRTTFPTNATTEEQLGDGKDHDILVLDVTLKNQDALQTILTKQEVLKGLIDKLQTTVSIIEEKVQAMEREMGALSQFTQELNQVGDDSNWA